MSKRETLKAVINEINKLNKKIDLKIIIGQDYKKEASQHKKLLDTYNKLTIQ
jgi:hypothetical protein